MALLMLVGAIGSAFWGVLKFNGRKRLWLLLPLMVVGVWLIGASRFLFWPELNDTDAAGCVGNVLTGISCPEQWPMAVYFSRFAFAWTITGGFVANAAGLAGLVATIVLSFNHLLKR
jgi:hypothetical protein